jgi:hypothetical protein
MAALHFEFVSPENVLFSGEVGQVDLPGTEGDMGILAGHAPLVTTLRPGIVTIFRGSAREPVVVTGGFAEVGPSGLWRHWRLKSKTPRKTWPTPPIRRSATSSPAISIS